MIESRFFRAPSIYRITVPHFLKFCPDPRLIFLGHLFRDILRKMELAALPRNIWKHLADGILDAFVSIRSNHQEILEAAIFQALEKSIPSRL